MWVWRSYFGREIIFRKFCFGLKFSVKGEWNKNFDRYIFSKWSTKSSVACYFRWPKVKTQNSRWPTVGRMQRKTLQWRTVGRWNFLEFSTSNCVEFSWTIHPLALFYSNTTTKFTRPQRRLCIKLEQIKMQAAK